jgi:hypothetical protein
MKILLFFITSIYSAIFFIFYKLNNWINIFSNFSWAQKNFSSLTWNLFYESVFFWILALFLFFYFWTNKFFIKKNIEKKESENIDECSVEGNFFNQKIINKHDNDKKNKNFLNISEEKKYLFRAIIFIILYIFIILGSLFLYWNFWDLVNITNNLFLNIFSKNTLFFIFNIFIILFLIISIFINFNIHKKYQNYISLFFSILAFVFIFNFIIKFILSIFFTDFPVIEILKIELILNITISFFIIIFTYLYSQKYLFDYTFLHFCAFIVNILWIINFFISWGFSLYFLFIIIFLNIILWLLSYFKFRKISIEKK